MIKDVHAAIIGTTGKLKEMNTNWCLLERTRLHTCGGMLLI
jgi:hypothetical protein